MQHKSSAIKISRNLFLPEESKSHFHERKISPKTFQQLSSKFKWKWQKSRCQCMSGKISRSIFVYFHKREIFRPFRISSFLYNISSTFLFSHWERALNGEMWFVSVQHVQVIVVSCVEMKRVRQMELKIWLLLEEHTMVTCFCVNHQDWQCSLNLLATRRNSLKNSLTQTQKRFLIYLYTVEISARWNNRRSATSAAALKQKCIFKIFTRIY